MHTNTTSVPRTIGKGGGIVATVGGTMKCEKFSHVMIVCENYQFFNLRPCSMVTLPLPVLLAPFVTVQLYVAKSCSDEGRTMSVLESSASTVPVLSFLHMNVVTPGLVLVTLQKRVVEPSRLTLVRDAVTCTSGGTGNTKFGNLLTTVINLRTNHL